MESVDTGGGDGGQPVEVAVVVGEAGVDGGGEAGGEESIRSGPSLRGETPEFGSIELFKSCGVE